MKQRRATELQCETTIIAAAKLGGWLVHAERTSRTQSGRYATAIKGHNGYPDLTMVHPDHNVIVIAELKRKPNRLEPDQIRWLDALHAVDLATGGRVHVAVWWVPDEVDVICAALAAGRIPVLDESSAA